ncbi:hypothetical protein WJX74_000956 [Apatococcus lobatus]|uniref:Uncharacterized protein n=1 Tax=Apatococcus lobatus TaxID=904363 RepID=A0AAW1RZX6_9CHLO
MPVQGTGTKTAALQACAQEHKDLLDCFKTCNIFGCNCGEQHNAFWDCYKRVRGEDRNKWLSPAGMLSRIDIQQLVATYTPIMYMHPADKFMPCSTEWFMERSCLEAAVPLPKDQVEWEVLIERGQVTIPQLLEKQEQNPGRALRLTLDPAARCGPPQDELHKVPVYANVKEVCRPDGPVEAIEINYLTFYAHNGTYDVGYMGLFKVGSHDGDWEHCTVRLDGQTGALQGVWYNAHRARDGCWLPAGVADREASTGRPRMYVALHGHGTYPRPASFMRAFFMANDRCSNAGAVWRPETCVILPAAPSAPGSPAPFRQVRSRGTTLPCLLPGLMPSAPLISTAIPAMTPQTPSVSLSNAAISTQRPQSAQVSSIYLPVSDLPDQLVTPSGPSRTHQPSQSLSNHNRCDDTQQQGGRTVLPRDLDVAGNVPKAAFEAPLHPITPQLHEHVMHIVGPTTPLAALPIDAGSQQQLETEADLSQELSHLHLQQHPQQLLQQPQSGDASVHDEQATSGSPDVASKQQHRGRLQEQQSGRGSVQCLTHGGVQVLDGPAEWVWFRGEWGTTLAPISQGWFHTAETPVSRSALLRVLVQAWPETQRI